MTANVHNNNPRPILTMTDASRSWPSQSVVALEPTTLQVDRGECVLVRGPSGGGKTTLLLLAGAMLQPTSGHVQRNGTVGFVFQTLELLPYLTVRENIALGLSPKQRDEDRLEHLLDLLQLRARASHRPHELSVGESQRTATARALVGNPALLLADEPTGNLDSENANLVLMAIREHANNSGAVLVASHGPTDALQPTRTLHLAAGTVADSRASTA